jgi:hypothetical protein
MILNIKIQFKFAINCRCLIIITIYLFYSFMFFQWINHNSYKLMKVGATNVSGIIILFYFLKKSELYT